MPDQRETEATVLVAYGSQGVVKTPEGRRLKAKFRRGVGRPCCGDVVDISPADANSWVVESIHDRKNRFLRADGHGRPQVVAANLDHVMIVVAPRPSPSQDILDRYLVAVRSLGIEAVIVHNKTDLAAEPGQAGATVLERLPCYAELGYPVVRTCCKQADGLSELAPHTRSGISILVGQSGVGKSSLVRRLLPDLDIQVGDLSRVTGKGTHTTTTTILYSLPDGGHLIDSPGVWEYGLWRLDDADIAAGFIEFEPFLGHCKFNDCLHQSEPECAVKEAVSKGLILAWRYETYLRLLAQNTTPRSG